MLEYVVDFLGFGQEVWWTGDQEAWEPKTYPKEKYRGKVAEPFNITVTKHCNLRASEGWRLHSMTPCAEGAPLTGTVHCVGAWLAFERTRS